MFVEHAAFNREIVSPSGRGQICFLTRLIRIMSPSSANIGQVCQQRFWKIGVSLTRVSSSVIQTCRVCSAPLGPSVSALWDLEDPFIRVNTKFPWPAILWGRKSIVSDLGFWVFFKYLRKCNRLTFSLQIGCNFSLFTVLDKDLPSFGKPFLTNPASSDMSNTTLAGNPTCWVMYLWTFLLLLAWLFSLRGQKQLFIPLDKYLAFFGGCRNWL